MRSTLSPGEWRFTSTPIRPRPIPPSPCSAASACASSSATRRPASITISRSRSFGVGLTPIAAGQVASFDLEVPDRPGRHEYACRPARRHDEGRRRDSVAARVPALGHQHAPGQAALRRPPVLHHRRSLRPHHGPALLRAGRPLEAAPCGNGRSPPMPPRARPGLWDRRHRAAGSGGGRRRHGARHHAAHDRPGPREGAGAWGAGEIPGRRHDGLAPARCLRGPGDDRIRPSQRRRPRRRASRDSPGAQTRGACVVARLQSSVVAAPPSGLPRLPHRRRQRARPGVAS